MKYFELNFNISAPAELLQDARDLLAALTAEAGLETFEETDGGLRGYAQQALLDHDALRQTIDNFPMDVAIACDISEAEERDWNEQWEQEGFQPIVVADRVVIHDGRHQPPLPIGSYPLAVEIDPHMAFGTGTHETTRMVIAALLAHDLSGRRVLDCGCGTGILAITALKLGARECVAYDIDEWSTDNARHNAIINKVELTPLLGDATVLDTVSGQFGIIMANINRNILLADMPRFCQKLAPQGTLILSGFYTADIPLLQQRAQELGLHLAATSQENDWACITLQK